MSLNKEALELAKMKLTESISLPDYYMDYVDEGIDLDRYNRDCCPLHDEDSPSFFYFEDSGRFHCFGCDKSGSVVDLHYHLKRRDEPSYNMIRAVKDLGNLYSVEIPNLFKNIDLKEKLNLGTSSKLAFKKPEELVKPLKKDISDFEVLLLKNKNNLPLNRFMNYVNQLDKILFKEGDVLGELKKLKLDLLKDLSNISKN